MNWNLILKEAMAMPEVMQLKNFIGAERKSGKNIYPDSKNVFRAFDECPFEKTKVVIIGREPYCTPDTADGLAFSTKQEERPIVLQQIFKEVYKDLNIQYYHGDAFEDFFPTNDLTKWTNNGILLLNSALTVEEMNPLSHQDKGWEYIIKHVVKSLVSLTDRQIIFLLWGEEANQYKELITGRHLSFSTEFPTEESKFNGCGHFSILRDILPTLSGNSMRTVDFTHEFNKEAAKEKVIANHSLYAKEICKYIDNRLIINIPVNPDAYATQLKEFEQSLSSKYDN